MAVCIAAMNAMVELGSQTQTTLRSMNNSTVNAINGTTRVLNTELSTIANQMCKWAVPTYGTIGESWDRTAKLAAEVAIYTSIIALNTYVNNQNYQIAKAYSNLAQDRWTRFRDGYAPLEKKLLAETSNTPEPTVPYSDAKSQGSSATDFAFGSAKSMLATYAKRYALCMDDCYDYARSQALMRDDNINFNYRNEESYREIKSDKRWNRRSDILNIGRSNLPTAYSYAQNASHAFTDFAGAVAGVGSGISGLLGYMFNRNETVYPAQFSQASLYGNKGYIAAVPGGSTTVGY